MTLFYDLLVKFGPLIKVDDLGFCLIIQAPDFNPKWEAELVNLGYTCYHEILDANPVVFVPSHSVFSRASQFTIKRTITEANSIPLTELAAGPKDGSMAPVKETPVADNLEKIDEAEVLIDLVGKLVVLNEDFCSLRKRIVELEKREIGLNEPIFACQQDLAKIKQDLEKRYKMGVFP
jgi:hypothetical protein